MCAMERVLTLDLNTRIEPLQTMAGDLCEAVRRERDAAGLPPIGGEG